MRVLPIHPVFQMQLILTAICYSGISLKRRAEPFPPQQAWLIIQVSRMAI